MKQLFGTLFLLLCTTSPFFSQELIEIKDLPLLQKKHEYLTPSAFDVAHSFKNGCKVVRVFKDSINLDFSYIYSERTAIDNPNKTNFEQLNQQLYYTVNRCSPQEAYGYLLIDAKGKKMLDGIRQIISLGDKSFLIEQNGKFYSVSTKLKKSKPLPFYRVLSTGKRLIIEDLNGEINIYDFNLNRLETDIADKIEAVTGGVGAYFSSDSWTGWDKNGKSLPIEEENTNSDDHWGEDDWGDGGWDDGFDDFSGHQHYSNAVKNILLITQSNTITFWDSKTLEAISTSIPKEKLRNKMFQVKGNVVILNGANDKYGLLINRGETFIFKEPQYDYASKYSKYIRLKKEGKIGCISLIHHTLFDANYKNAFIFSNYGAFVKDDNTISLLDLNTKQPLNVPSFDKIKTLRYNNDSLLVFQKGEKFGIYSPYTQKTLIDASLDELSSDTYCKHYKKVKKGKLYGLIDTRTGEIAVPIKYNSLMELTKTRLVVTYDDKNAFYDLDTKKITIRESIADVFAKKWSKEIGFTSFRTNIIEDNGNIIVGSNGADRESKEDKYDGVYILAANDGEVKHQLGNTSAGDNDVNGVALDGKKLFFGNDNKAFYCYTTAGKLLWKYTTLDDTEGCPAVADLNKDGVKDVIFATEGFGLTALNGKNGQEIWKRVHPEKNYGFMGSPALVDLNKDGIVDVLIGGCGHPQKLQAHRDGYMWALNGKNGDVLWQYELGSQLHSSPVVYKDKDKLMIAQAESYVWINFFNAKGEREKVISFQHGLFATPVFNSTKEKVYIGNSWWSNEDKFTAADVNKGEWRSKYKIDKFKGADGISTTTGRISASAVIADILPEHQGMEVIVPTENADLLITDEDGKELKRIPLPGKVEATPLVKDIDGDGLLELIIANTNGTITCYETKSKGKVYIGQFRFNNQNTGVLK